MNVYVFNHLIKVESMNKIAMSNIQRAVRENTCEMGTEEYATFMRTLAEWVTSQADMAEYAECPDMED